jgi:hypothetical protein
MQPQRIFAVITLSILSVSLAAFSETPPAPGADSRFAQSVSEGFCNHGEAIKRDDAFHYKYWEGTPYDVAYTEWWYFNLYDASQDLQAIFSYQVVDPSNVSGQGTAFVSAAAYQDSSIVNTFDLFPLSSFSASYSAANVALGHNRISALGQDTYQIEGSSSNGRIAWNLEYQRASEPWCAADHVNVAPASWEQMSWLLYMPRALVTGTVIIDGDTYNVQSAGYHDHNWGEWDLAQVRWNWAQYSEPGLSFDLGDFIGNPNGKASVDIRGRRFVFNTTEYKLVHTKWAYDSQNNTFYPTESIFNADNGLVHVFVRIDVTKTDPLAVFPGQIIYEQPSHFRGRVTVQDRTDGPPFEIEFKGNGFREYTAVTHPAQPI